MSKFTEFPKMPRLSRQMIITEKIDGTNASIFIQHVDKEAANLYKDSILEIIGNLTIRAGSRTKWITPKDDNYGFASWVKLHAHDLIKLGEGRHFGEWWGSGINRGYNLPKGEKRFSLFNVSRWHLNGQPSKRIELENPLIEKYQEELPECCYLVPELYRGMFDTSAVDFVLDQLKQTGSICSPGFMDPEGVVVFHVAGNFGFKKTIKKDELPKSKL